MTEIKRVANVQYADSCVWQAVFRGTMPLGCLATSKQSKIEPEDVGTKYSP